MTNRNCGFQVLFPLWRSSWAFVSEHVHVSQFFYSLLHTVCVVSHTLKGNCSVRRRDRCRMCSAMPSSSVTSAVMIPTWDVLHPTACSQPARWARANRTFHTSLLWYMKFTTTYNLIFWLAAQHSGCLKVTANQCGIWACSLPLLRLAAALQRARDFGDEHFGIESQGESPPLSSRPPPIGGESSATQSPLTAPEAAALQCYF